MIKMINLEIGDGSSRQAKNIISFTFQCEYIQVERWLPRRISRSPMELWDLHSHPSAESGPLTQVLEASGQIWNVGYSYKGFNSCLCSSIRAKYSLCEQLARNPTNRATFSLAPWKRISMWWRKIRRTYPLRCNWVAVWRRYSLTPPFIEKASTTGLTSYNRKVTWTTLR